MRTVQRAVIGIASLLSALVAVAPESRAQPFEDFDVTVFFVRACFGDRALAPNSTAQQLRLATGHLERSPDLFSVVASTMNQADAVCSQFFNGSDVSTDDLDSTNTARLGIPASGGLLMFGRPVTSLSSIGNNGLYSRIPEKLIVDHNELLAGRDAGFGELGRIGSQCPTDARTVAKGEVFPHSLALYLAAVDLTPKKKGADKKKYLVRYASSKIPLPKTAAKNLEELKSRVDTLLDDAVSDPAILFSEIADPSIPDNRPASLRPILDFLKGIGASDDQLIRIKNFGNLRKLLARLALERENFLAGAPGFACGKKKDQRCGTLVKLLQKFLKSAKQSDKFSELTFARDYDLLKHTCVCDNGGDARLGCLPKEPQAPAGPRKPTEPPMTEPPSTGPGGSGPTDSTGGTGGTGGTTPGGCSSDAKLSGRPCTS